MTFSEKLFIILGYLTVGVVYVYSITGWQKSRMYSLVDFLSDVVAVLIWPVILMSRIIQCIQIFFNRRK